MLVTTSDSHGTTERDRLEGRLPRVCLPVSEAVHSRLLAASERAGAETRIATITPAVTGGMVALRFRSGVHG